MKDVEGSAEGLDSSVIKDVEDGFGDGAKPGVPAVVDARDAELPDIAIEPGGWELLPRPEDARFIAGFAGRSDDDVWVAGNRGPDDHHLSDYVWQWDGHAFGHDVMIGAGWIEPTGLCADADAYWTVSSGDHVLMRDLVRVAGSVTGQGFRCATHAVFAMGTDGHWRRHGERVDGWPAFDDGLSSIGTKWNDLYAAADDDVWVVGAAGAIARWNGTSWRSIPSSVSTDFRKVVGSSSNDVYLQSAGGIMHWDGVEFRSLDLPSPGEYLVPVAVAGPGEAYFAEAPTSYSAPTWIARWDGKAWTRLSVPGSSSVESFEIGWVSPSYLWVGGINVYRRRR